MRRLAGAMLLVALVANEFVFVRLSADGTLDPSTIFSIRLLQSTLVVSGVALALRKRAVLLVLILVLAALNLAAFRKQVVSTPSETRWAMEARRQQLRSWLPAQGRVGYLNDEISLKTGSAIELYYLTQYAIAPLVLELGATQEWVIGDIPSFDGQPPPGLEVAHEFGGGLVLFHTSSGR
jgi:hypothetical protein